MPLSLLILRAARRLLTFLYKVEVTGMEHYAAAGERRLIVANHTSLLDAALLAVFLPEKPTFAINTHIAKKWWMKPLLPLANTFALDPTRPLATKALIEQVRRGVPCVIFPEGRITVTGSLMKIYEGPGMIADKAGATIIPICINGAQYTPFSYLKGKVRLRLFPKIRLTVLPPQLSTIPPEIKGRERRVMAGRMLYDVMTTMLFQSSWQQQSLFQSLLDAQAIHGPGHRIAEDIDRKPLSYRQFIARSLILGKVIAEETQAGDYVGVLLPSMVNTAITFFALLAYGRVPAMLNFSTGTLNVVSACNMAQLKRVYTSRRFIEAAELGNMVTAITEAGVQVVYLEDLRPRITFMDKLRGFLKASYEEAEYNDANMPAVVLFTSGSEGTPKGVVLSHANIQANRCQLASRVDFGPLDRIFNALPLFHSFGLTGGMLLPLLAGVKVFFYPSPLHYRIVPELIYDTDSTIMFGTDTFLNGYARYAHAYDFYSLRYVFAGAEKLKESTRKLWSEKFGVRIFEGYGATETSPILSTNTPMHNKPGTVGRLMPGITYRLEPVPGVTEGGKLVVSGPNIMLGYLHADNPGVIQPPPEGWYDTGDIVSVDNEGYIAILGRAKRFAKVGGEMVSLTAVEQYLSDLWPGKLHAVIAVADEKKGEQLILVTDEPAATREAIIIHTRAQGIAELSVPRQVMVVDKVPLLGTGKVDYVRVQTLVSS